MPYEDSKSKMQLGTSDIMSSFLFIFYVFNTQKQSRGSQNFFLA